MSGKELRREAWGLVKPFYFRLLLLCLLVMAVTFLTSMLYLSIYCLGSNILNQIYGFCSRMIQWMLTVGILQVIRELPEQGINCRGLLVCFSSPQRFCKAIGMFFLLDLPVALYQIASVGFAKTVIAILLLVLFHDLILDTLLFPGRYRFLDSPDAFPLSTVWLTLRQGFQHFRCIFIFRIALYFVYWVVIWLLFDGPWLVVSLFSIRIPYEKYMNLSEIYNSVNFLVKPVVQVLPYPFFYMAETLFVRRVIVEEAHCNGDSGPKKTY